jgi:putative membrane protein
MFIDLMPTFNAILNATSGVLVTTGYVFIRRRRVSAHRACMIGALACSCLFLISYLTYHVGFGKGVTRFAGTGAVRWFYLSVLTSHTILAVVIVPFVIVTVRRALKPDFAKHRRVARWTFPMWLYVSITGVLVYLMLYHIYPSRP